MYQKRSRALTLAWVEDTQEKPDTTSTVTSRVRKQLEPEDQNNHSMHDSQESYNLTSLAALLSCLIHVFVVSIAILLTWCSLKWNGVIIVFDIFWLSIQVFSFWIPLTLSVIYLSVQYIVVHPKEQLFLLNYVFNYAPVNNFFPTH